MGFFPQALRPLLQQKCFDESPTGPLRQTCLPFGYVGIRKLEPHKKDRKGELVSVHLKLQRRMAGSTPESMEDKELFVHRSCVKLKQWRDKWNCRNWDFQLEIKCFNWAGHVARFATWDPSRITYTIFRFRDNLWLQQQRQQLGNQGHGRRCRVWRWESRVIHFFTFKGNWLQWAQDKQWWQSHFEDMVLGTSCIFR